MLDELITYISSCITSDSTLPSTIPVIEAYKYGHKPTTTEIQVQILSDAEREASTTFEGERASSLSVQFTVYAKQMTYGNAIISSQKAARVISEKIKRWLGSSALHTGINDVIRSVRTSISPAMPVESGTEMYSMAVRAEIIIKY